MDIVIEFEEIEVLIREALKARGMSLHKDGKMSVRQNHKKNTVRVVFTYGAQERNNA